MYLCRKNGINISSSFNLKDVKIKDIENEMFRTSHP